MEAETLVRGDWDGEICNLRFRTHRRTAWIDALETYYVGRVTQKTIQDALQLVIDASIGRLTVNLYNTGTVMVQGARPVLTTFENQTFHELRGMVEQTAQQIRNE